MLEHTGCFLDEAAPLFRCCTQNRVELSLADDDVHLTADTGVREEFLHIEQSAGLTVDRVLRPAVAEQDARDRDLGVLDRERTIGIVDCEQHFGTTERGASGSAGKDDVFHLAAAKRLRALFAHDPGEGIDDVGLARTVGADDTGDTRLELKGGA